jgi:transcriptional regulator with GAF, ATPase, and Fis domain
MNPTETNTHATATSPGLEVSAEVLATLAEIGEEVNASLDLDEVLAKTAALIKRHIDYEIFGVLMLEGDGSLRRICASRWGRELQGRRRRRDTPCA